MSIEKSHENHAGAEVQMQCKNRWEQYEGDLNYDYNEDTEAEVNCLLQFSTYYMGVIFYLYSKCQLNFEIVNTIHVCQHFKICLDFLRFLL